MLEPGFLYDAYDFRLSPDDKLIWYRSSSLQYTVIGKSDLAIAETAAFLWRLDIENEFRFIRSMDCFDFSVVSMEQLGLLFQTHQTKHILLSLSNISLVQSEFLARLPYPISISLCGSSLGAFSDGGHAFVEALVRRDSPFDDLKLSRLKESDDEAFQRIVQVEIIKTLKIQYMELSSRQARQLLSASAKGIEFTIAVQDVLDLDWSTVDIVPKELSVTFKCSDQVSHLSFVIAFLRRVAQIGDFVKLNLAFRIEEHMHDALVKELIRAVDANQSLVELRLHRSMTNRANHLDDMLRMMERHKGLRRVTLDHYQFELKPYYAMLKQLLNRNRFIDVLTKGGNLVTDGDEIDRIYAFNQFVRSSQGLTKEPLSRLPLLVGEVLVRSANHDFRRSALVMANHADALCELVEYSSNSAEEVPIEHC